jgi:SEC-C motif
MNLSADLDDDLGPTFGSARRSRGARGPVFHSPDGVAKDLAEEPELILERSRRRCRGPIEDTVAEMSWWACFHREDSDRPGSSTEATPAAFRSGFTRAPWPEPFVRDGPKVGRNDPCPCGSGKKYEKCCLWAG